jgi:hypothetical protein
MLGGVLVTAPAYRFLSLRSADVAAKDAGPEAPPNLVAAHLKAQGLEFELVECRLEREEAAVDPETSDLYPDGLDSGPGCVFIYDFLTSERSDFVLLQTASSDALGVNAPGPS